MAVMGLSRGWTKGFFGEIEAAAIFLQNIQFSKNSQKTDAI